MPGVPPSAWHLAAPRFPLFSLSPTFLILLDLGTLCFLPKLPPHLFSNTISGLQTMVDGTLSIHRPS